MSTQYTPTPLPTLRAINWSCHAPTTIVGEIEGKQVVFAECSGIGSGRYSIEDAVFAAEIVQRCNSHDALFAALEAARPIVELAWARNPQQSANAEALTKVGDAIALAKGAA